MEKGSVLIVDDEPLVRDTLRDILENEGYSVVAVGSTKVALQEAERRNIDVAVIDYVLPTNSGLVLVRRLREQNPQVMPILITGYSTRVLAELASRCEVFDYIAKPVEKARLCSTVAKALEIKKLIEQAFESKMPSKGIDNLVNKPVESEKQASHCRLLLVKMQALHACELFEKFDTRQLKDMLDLCKFRSYEAGETIYAQGTHAEQIYIIERGSVVLTIPINARGKQQLKKVEVLGRGKVFGWEVLTGSSVYIGSAVSQSSTKIIAINGFELRFILVRKPSANLEIMEKLCTLATKRLRASYDALGSKN